MKIARRTRNGQDELTRLKERLARIDLAALVGADILERSGETGRTARYTL